jgi:hypothetical protein
MSTGVDMVGSRTSRRPAGRRVAVGALALVALALFGLTGCQQDNTPKEYGIVTQQNFLELCTNHYFDNTDDTLAITDNTIASVDTVPTQSQCQCQYDVFVNQMSISDFTTLNAKLKTNPEEGWGTVPDTIKTAITACMGTQTVPTDSPTTTVASTEPSTTVNP